MSDPVTGTSALFSGGFLGALFYGLVTHTDYGVVFGAFAGAVFYAATAAHLSRLRLIAYFLTSFIVGVIGAGLMGAKLAALTGYTDPSLDALGAVLISALIIKVLKFLYKQDLMSLVNWLVRNKEGGPGGKK
nr:phage holin family protein [uncultured Enterobacter sp.]